LRPAKKKFYIAEFNESNNELYKLFLIEKGDNLKIHSFTTINNSPPLFYQNSVMRSLDNFNIYFNYLVFEKIKDSIDYNKVLLNITTNLETKNIPVVANSYHDKERPSIAFSKIQNIFKEGENEKSQEITQNNNTSQEKTLLNTLGINENVKKLQNETVKEEVKIKESNQGTVKKRRKKKKPQK